MNAPARSVLGAFLLVIFEGERKVMKRMILVSNISFSGLIWPRPCHFSIAATGLRLDINCFLSCAMFRRFIIHDFR